MIYGSTIIFFFLFALFSQDLMQVRLNSYRAFHPSMDLSTQQKYYSFFPNLIEMSKEAKYKKTFSMDPDVVLIVNNWRLLHGRTDFQVCTVHND